MEWIKVTDKLPEKPYKDVLVYTILNGIYVGFYDEDFGRMSSASRHIGNITHWMPLPEPPKN